MAEERNVRVVELLAPEMREAVEEAARAEQRQPDELVQDAVRRYLKDRHWEALVSYGRERARALGYKPSDVNRLIAEQRRESRAHER